VVGCEYEVVGCGWVGLGGVSTVLWGGRLVRSLFGESTGDHNYMFWRDLAANSFPAKSAKAH